jgi:TRAP-type C4-dicarboxylate transport system permease small subunit
MTKPHETITGRTDALRQLDGAVDVTVGFALLGELVVVIANVLGRMFFETPLLWVDEVSGFALSIIAFLGGAIAYRREQHVLVRTLVNMLPSSWRLACYAWVDWLVLEIALLTGFQSLALLAFRWEQTTPILGLSATWIAVPRWCSAR